MPVILKKSFEELWLDKKLTDENKLLSVLKPYDAKEMKEYQVSKAVNWAAADTKELILPVKAKPADFKTAKNMALPF